MTYRVDRESLAKALMKAHPAWVAEADDATQGSLVLDRSEQEDFAVLADLILAHLPNDDAERAVIAAAETWRNIDTGWADWAAVDEALDALSDAVDALRAARGKQP